MPRDIFLNLIRRKRVGIAVAKNETESARLLYSHRAIFHTENELRETDVIA